MPTPKDKLLYDKIKNEVLLKNPINSAYRSGLIVKKYKEAYNNKYNSNDAYIGKKSNSDLKRWFDEVWTNQRGEIGYKYNYDIYRPNIRVNKDTPTTFKELSKEQIKNAMNKKKNIGRVNKFNI